MFILNRHDIYVSTANINCSCELKACSIKKSWNPMVPLALPVVPELSALCIIGTFVRKKEFSIESVIQGSNMME